MVEQMYRRFRESPESVSSAWQDYFAGHDVTQPSMPSVVETVVAPPVGTPAGEKPASEPEKQLPDGAVAIRGVGARIVEAMETSLDVPTATSVRSIPAKLLEVNRRILNNQLSRQPRGGKVSFTHLIGWAVVRALREMPEMNVSYTEVDGAPFKVSPEHINLGLAVDMAGRDGERVLIVPNIKGTEQFDFRGFWEAYESLIRKVQANAITVDDFAGTTASLTNPGMIGTVQSVPRLMQGQGLIVGVGAIIYPPEYQAADHMTLARLGIGRVITITSTYDHRVIQGAASGRFLDLIHRYLLGEHGFYDEIFSAMHVPYTPARWAVDTNPPFGTPQWAEKQARVFSLINAYRVRGHLIADLDPLEQEPPQMPKELDILTYGLTIWDLDREFATNGVGGQPMMTLGQLLGVLRDAYCRTTGIEYMHIQEPDEKAWLQARLERDQGALELDDKVEILERLNAAEAFESFLHTKYVGHKRFGLEGVESLIPLMSTILDKAAVSSIDEVVIGMSHRGRLNVLANIVGKPYGRIFREFAGNVDPETTQGSGDVKYHLGASGEHRTRSGHTVRVQVVANPSHLEAVDPVLEGVVRAKQERIGKEGHRRVMAMLLHGDAAFAGQGVVVETLNLSQLPGYRTGGTVHIIVNNQVGFTTSVADARSSQYATDVAKTVQAPIIHVNADDPEAVVRAGRLAFAYREQFSKDVIVDMIGYRRRGHNEGDEPSFTQPLMYRTIDAHQTVRTVYLNRLVAGGEVTEEAGAALMDEFRDLLQEAFESTKDLSSGPSARLDTVEEVRDPDTRVGIDVLADINAYVTTPPEGFTVHPKLERLLETRRAQFADGVVDWAMAEYLAFGSIAQEGHWVRVAGEDSKRGTFSHRHAALVDYATGKPWIALQERTSDTARVRFVDSLLSEFAAVGFEYGYSIEQRDALVAWEAQFGDFANGAQVIIDQFVSAGEDKWRQYSGLVLLLPHGFEGQGPEHSSARLERYLQLCAEDNIQVTLPSTAAQLFHLLRRQVKQQPHRPLVVMSPKSLLRRQSAYSTLSDLTDRGFLPVIDEQGRATDVSRIVLCSGKIFHDLDEARLDDSPVTLVRLEQLYPFPSDEVAKVLQAAPAAELVWVQEEPTNMGAAAYVRPHIAELTDRVLISIGREPSASPAVGSLKAHTAEQAELIRRALDLSKS
jgi:2-oxoglutarate dehydrogenase E1 component